MDFYDEILKLTQEKEQTTKFITYSIFRMQIDLAIKIFTIIYQFLHNKVNVFLIFAKF